MEKKKTKIEEPKQYVLVHVRKKDFKGNVLPEVLLVLKDRPLWQKGRLNLVGGKVEKDETIVFAAMRELQEETGLVGTPAMPKLCGAIKGVDCVVYCFVADVTQDSKLNPREGETEIVDWFNLSEVFSDTRLMPNLQLIIPLLHLESSGWIITDKNSSSNTHEVLVSLDIQKPFVNG